MSDLPKGAILQRDKETYAIRMTPPSGVVTPDQLEAVAAAARKYDIPVVKLTSAQRFAFIGLKEENVADAVKDIPLAYGGFYVQSCSGQKWCKMAMQDSDTMATDMEERYARTEVPAKIKMGVSGCPMSCSESYVRDIAMVGTRKGWTVVIGGNAGARARVADELATGLEAGEALDLVDRFLDYYREHGKKKQRVARFVETVGIEEIQKALGC